MKVKIVRKHITSTQNIVRVSESGIYSTPQIGTKTQKDKYINDDDVSKKNKEDNNKAKKAKKAKTVKDTNINDDSLNDDSLNDDDNVDVGEDDDI